MIIHKIYTPKPLITRKRVAAYVRVSTESERPSNSLSAQISYDNNLIQRHPEWVYVDRFISGTDMEKRQDFQRLISDCEAGKIEIILTKSISRFARNTVDLLSTVRRLKELGIAVKFEKENIDSLTSDGELMLSILAGFAEEESKSISANVKWGIRKRFEAGKQWSKEAFGYRWDGASFKIQEDEAERGIYRQFLVGKRVASIRQWVNKHGFSTITNKRITFILGNELYKGDLLLQKNFTPNPLDHKRKQNRGELPQYYVTGSHEAIVLPEMWDAVQEKMREAREFNPAANKIDKRSVFTKKIVCNICGNHYNRRTNYASTHSGKAWLWVCYEKHRNGRTFCPSVTLREDRLKEAATGVLGLDVFNEKVFTEKIQTITIGKPDQTKGEIELSFYFYDGTVKRALIRVYARPNHNPSEG